MALALEEATLDFINAIGDNDLDIVEEVTHDNPNNPNNPNHPNHPNHLSMSNLPTPPRPYRI